MNKKTFTMVVCSILFAGVVIGALTYMFHHPLTHEYYIFQNLEECELLLPADRSQINIDRYDSPDSDKSLKELHYHDFWGLKFQSDALEYEIFAYEFTDADSALQYYINVTGQHRYEKKLPLKSEDENKFLSASKGTSSYRMIGVYQNRAYQIITPKQYADEVNKLLANTFSQKLT